MNQKTLAPILIIIVILGAILYFFYPFSKDTPSPLTVAETLPAQKEGKIVVSSPLPNSTLSVSPVIIKGKAVGNWFFEASAPVDIVNWDGLIIGQGFVKVDAGYDWMTTAMVPFTGTISYDASQLGPYKYGWIIMKKDNPSGESQFDDSLEFKILFP